MSLILVTIFSIVFSLPIFPYVIFQGLVREDIKREAIKNTSNDKLADVMRRIWICLVHVGAPILISVEAFVMVERWYLLPIAYAIFWQIIWACIAMKKNILPVILPILAIFYIICIGVSLRN